MGKPVVSTSIGCEGLDAVDGENILIRDDPKDFANAIVALLGDSALRRRLADAGRATAERFYSWEVIGRAMIDAYLGARHAGTSGAASAIRVPGEARYGHS
jgi:glycosyltransferase involved in cell wall biosynthesis